VREIPLGQAALLRKELQTPIDVIPRHVHVTKHRNKMIHTNLLPNSGNLLVTLLCRVPHVQVNEHIEQRLGALLFCSFTERSVRFVAFDGSKVASV